MTRKLYIRPIALAESPQSEAGEAVRLGGAMVWASRFALITRDQGRVVARDRVSAAQLPAALAALPADLGAQAEAQWANLRKAHPPLQCGARTIRLDQPQVMGILNMTPDSFSDGGQFLDDPQIAADHAAAMLEAGAAIIDIGGGTTPPGARGGWGGGGPEARRPGG